MKITFFTALIFSMLYPLLAFSQVEIVDIDHPVYDFLERMHSKNIISGYNSANLPVSRYRTGKWLSEISNIKSRLSSTDKDILNYYLIEFEKEVFGRVSNQYGLFNSGTKEMFSDKKEKHFYMYNDSNASVFLDGLTSVSVRKSNGDSLGDRNITLGEIGYRLRGTFYNSVALYLRASNSQQLTGDSLDLSFAKATDKRIFSSGNIRDFRHTYFDTFEGYLRYMTQGDWLSLSAGRYGIKQGTGYLDKIFISNNAVPFDFIKFDLNYKFLNYSFLYGGLRGDSLGRPLESKNISTHRLDILFSNKFKAGVFESVIISNSPFNFTFFNPVSFLFSAEMNKASQGDEKNANNTILGFDFELIPVSGVKTQASLIIDDLDFSTLFKDNANISNKTGYQIGTLWFDAFTVPNLSLAVEYTRLNPYIYVHKTNKSNYAHWNLPLGHHIPPNSDEIAAGLSFRFSSRFSASTRFGYTRHAEGIDSTSAGIINYGGNIENGSGEGNISPVFLEGSERLGITDYKFSITFEPLRQFYVDINYFYKKYSFTKPVTRSITDSYVFFTLRIDY